MKIKHPLLNADSKHYDTKEKSAIQELEEELTIYAAIGFCEGNIIKYEYRKKAKGQEESDKKKIKTYSDYVIFLYKQKHDFKGKGVDLFYLTVAEVYRSNGIEIDYKL
jgi:hypothetical protein